MGVKKNLRPYREFSLISTVQIIFFCIVPFICFYCLEYYTHDPWLMAPLPQLINYLLFFTAGLFFYALTGRSWCSVLILTLYSLTAGAANYFVMDFRNNPILPWDLKSVATAMTVSDNYSYQIDLRFLTSSAILLLLLLCGLFFRKKAEKPLFSAARLKNTALPLLCFLLLAIGMMNTAVTDIVLTPVNLFTQWASYRDNGFTVTFLQNLQYLHIKKPEGYRADTVDQELDDFLNDWKKEHRNTALLPAKDTAADTADATDAADTTGATNTEAAKKPHVIVLMNESFSDLSVLHEFETSTDYMPYVHSLQKKDLPNLITGNLFVSVCAGNTANTEFEFLTGNTMAFLPPGSMPYQQYIFDSLPSLASQFDKDGYTSVGLHPYAASGWNRNLVYPLLGFEKTCFREGFPGARIIRKYVSDESAYAKIAGLYETREIGEKLMLFEVTMQNHGGYSTLYDSFPIDVKLKDIHTATSYATEHYLSLVKESDLAFEELISYFETADEPVLILTFGDHQPNDFVSENIASLTGTPKEERSLKEAQNRYIVPYVIWANYDLKKESVGLSESTLSVNYLGACLRGLSGQTLSSYQEFLLILKEALPVITANAVIDRNGNYMTVEEAKMQYSDLMNLYEKLQYHMLFD
ncbi:MAG: LTA synthase family protein [Lachnospiraceae bacterium]|nr:LTA synthase family protein [Lachnospiraceae bacterium]